MGKTLYDKIWDAHIVHQTPFGATLLYVDRQLVHEVTSPQAFEALRLKKRRVRHPQKTIATMDHNVPTQAKDLSLADSISRLQMETLEKNCKEFGIVCLHFTHPDQGVVHIIGPELSVTQPGMIVVCGDSHTATHGAFGALAFGIGTSEVEHVLATQTLLQSKSKTLQIQIHGSLQKGVTPKDVILYIIGRIGTDGATGYVIEYCGSTIADMSMEGRMTICNMSIEAGARAGMVAPDTKTFTYLQRGDHAPKGKHWETALQHWHTLKSDPDAAFDKIITIQADEIIPQITWGTSPEQGVGISQSVPDPKDFSCPDKIKAAEKALAYMGLKPKTPMTSIAIDAVFIGSCTNGRIEDLRAAAKMIEGKRVARGVEALVVPGSARVKRQAEAEGLDKIFQDSGFQWRQPGCSMCLAMNEDRLKPYSRCVSTTNRNFEGRQGKDSRTHLASPETAAISAIHGRISDIRESL